MRGKAGGPKTAAGKARSKMNAVKHGLRAESGCPVIVGTEKHEEWEAFRKAFLDAWEPEGGHEAFLANEIAALGWRLRRVPVAEAALIETRIHSIPDDMAAAARYGSSVTGTPPEEYLTEENHDRHFRRSLIPSDRDAFGLVRYESALHRRFIQTSHELEAIQTRRQGGQAPLARLDISGPPGA